MFKRILLVICLLMILLVSSVMCSAEAVWDPQWMYVNQKDNLGTLYIEPSFVYMLPSKSCPDIRCVLKVELNDQGRQKYSKFDV